MKKKKKSKECLHDEINPIAMIDEDILCKHCGEVIFTTKKVRQLSQSEFDKIYGELKR